MKQNEFYITDRAPLADRESFNNTIILLTMVRSSDYYIVGFSRPEHIIKVGFDSDANDFAPRTELVTIDFTGSQELIRFNSTIESVNVDNTLLRLIEKEGNGRFFIQDNSLQYSCSIEKDEVFPIGMRQMNTLIMQIKSDIFSFTQRYYDELRKNE